MSRRLTALCLLTGALLLACSDHAGPPLDTTATGSEVVQDRAFRPLSWKSMDGPLQFTAEQVSDGDTRLDHEGVLASPSAGAPILNSYEVSFWAVVGEARGVKINWLDVSESGGYLMVTSRPYLTFVVPPDGLDEDPYGSDYESGDSVLITVTIDTSAMTAYFAPSGLTFDDDSPATLQYWYTGAGGDLDGNGAVDKEDAYIEQRLLDLWTTQKGSTWWTPVWAEHSLSEDWFKAGIEHFSGFAIAY